MVFMDDGVASPAADQRAVDRKRSPERDEQADREAPPEEKSPRPAAIAPGHEQDEAVVDDLHHRDRDRVSGERDPRRLTKRDAAGDERARSASSEKEGQHDRDRDQAALPQPSAVAITAGTSPIAQPVRQVPGRRKGRAVQGRGRPVLPVDVFHLAPRILRAHPRGSKVASREFLATVATGDSAQGKAGCSALGRGGFATSISRRLGRPRAGEAKDDEQRSWRPQRTVPIQRRRRRVAVVGAGQAGLAMRLLPRPPRPPLRDPRARRRDRSCLARALGLADARSRLAAIARCQGFPSQATRTATRPATR